jgi:hypothetical protein
MVFPNLFLFHYLQWERNFLFKPTSSGTQLEHANDLVLPAKKEKVLQGMTDGFNKICRCYGTEMNVKNLKVIRISRQRSPI